MNPNFETLEFPLILAQLKGHAISDNAKNALDRLAPMLSEAACNQKMAETTAARRVLDACGAPPLAMMKGLAETLALSEIGAMLMPEQLTGVAVFAASIKRMVSYLRRGESQNQELASYGCAFAPLDELQSEIESRVSEEQVYGEASSELRSLRRKMEGMEAKIKEKLAQILQSRKRYLTDNYITSRNGRYVLPVQRRCQNQFGGTVIDSSSKGSTVFMEPTAIAGLQAELGTLSIAEDAEVRRILYTLTAEVAQSAAAIRRNMELMEVLDVLFAKAKLSAAMKARAVAVSGQRRLCIRQGRHPLLDPGACVPLDFEMDEGATGVIITGPNTGGKTVTVKTVGLLSLMAQCGLHIPCAEGSHIAMQDGFWCDIGDSQSISQNLSTFSGHMTNVIHILENASPDSLVLLDELGSGTDPAEGMGIAIAVLEELRLRRCIFLVTTHYPQVKSYAERACGVQSARMTFDPESLRPLYQLEMGKSGESCALHIAGRLGLAPHLLAHAYHEVYGVLDDAAWQSETMQAPKSKLVRTAPPKPINDLSTKFSMGDSVLVLPDKEIGIVYRSANELGDVIVQVKGKKRAIRHNRLQLRVPTSELYPPDYDFSVVFDTVANRKTERILSKRYDPNAMIIHGADDLNK